MRTTQPTQRPLVYSATRFVAVATCLSLALPALAAPGENQAELGSTEESTPEKLEADRLRNNAAERFADGDYQAAIHGFEAAHKVSADPTDLFNLGRIHEELGELEAALEYYERFVGEPHLSLEQRRLAAERIDVLRLLVDPEEDESEFSPISPAPTERDDVRSAARPLIVSGSVLLGVGAALAAGGGVAFGLRGRRARDEIDEIMNGSNPGRLSLGEAEDLDARGKNADALQISFLVGGGVIAAVGASLLAVGLVRRSKRRGPEVAGSFGPQNATLTAKWRF